MIKKFVSILLILAFACAFASCSDSNEPGEQLTIVTTLFPQYDFARSIVGDKGQVKLLLPPGGDSHSFELTASDIMAIKNCDIFVYTGPGMEIWADNIIGTIDKSVDVINLSESVELICASHHDHEEPNDSHDTDPHIWTSPVNAMKMLEVIYNSICKADESNKEYYTENYNKYLSALNSLNEDFLKIANGSNNKTLYFCGKFAFAYFVKEYGFDYVAPFDSCSDLQVEDLASVANLIEQIKKNDVKYVFYEEFASNAVYKTIASETNATPLLLHSAHNVTSQEFSDGITYLQIMENNLNNLKKALNYD